MMFRSALRPSSWLTLPSRRLKSPVQNVCSRRHQSVIARSRKPRPWKSALFKWAVAVGGVYYYTKSDLFAAEREEIAKDNKSLDSSQGNDNITIEAILERKNQQKSLKLAEDQSQVKLAELGTSQVQNIQNDVLEKETKEDGPNNAETSASGREGAFDPETGKINWDCPCLGGMAHGPCGEEFKAAFSCFVYSEEEPKGVECIEKFKTMQGCFRQYPEIYGSELDDDTTDSEPEDVAVENNSEDLQKVMQAPEQSTSRSTDSKSQPVQQLSNDNEKSDTIDKDESSKESSKIASS